MEQTSSHSSLEPTIRERFLQAYANLPLGTRDEIVAVIDKEPVTWRAAYFEVANDTPRGQEIFKIIESLKIL